MPRVTELDLLGELLKTSREAGGPKTPEITGPNQAMYGIYGQQYAGSLNNQAANDPYFGPVAQMRLNDRANAEAAAYEEQLAAQQEAQLRAQESAQGYGLRMKVLDKEPAGMIGMREVRNTPEGYGVFNDPVLQATSNAMVVSESDAARRKDTASAVADLAGAGYGPAAEDVGPMMRGVTEPLGSETSYGVYMKPSDVTGRINSRSVDDELKLIEAKERYKAQYGTSSDDDGVEWKQEINPVTGLVEWTAKGSARALAGEGSPPPGYPNPNADAQTGGVSATQAGDPDGFFTTARVTSGLGKRKAPTAGASTNHKGVDYRGKLGEPIPAEKDGHVIRVGPRKGFGNNVVEVQYDDGETVFYGHNRAASVRPGQRVTRGMKLGEVGSEGRSTGPHVHRQQVRAADPKKQPQVAGTRTNKMTVLAQRAKTAGMNVTALDNGEVHITSTDGTKTQVFDATTGKRIR